MTDRSDGGTGRPDILTWWELDDLKARRAQPAPELSPKPNGYGIDRERENKEQEARIRLIETRFKALREQAEYQHTMSRLKGKARSHFRGQER